MTSHWASIKKESPLSKYKKECLTLDKDDLLRFFLENIDHVEAEYKNTTIGILKLIYYDTPLTEMQKVAIQLSYAGIMVNKKRGNLCHETE